MNCGARLLSALLVWHRTTALEQILNLLLVLEDFLYFLPLTPPLRAVIITLHVLESVEDVGVLSLHLADAFGPVLDAARHRVMLFKLTLSEMLVVYRVYVFNFLKQFPVLFLHILQPDLFLGPRAFWVDSQNSLCVDGLGNDRFGGVKALSMLFEALS